MKIAIPVATERCEVPNYFINVAYVNFVKKAGFVPVLITPQDEDIEADGLLLPGGIDVDPIYFGYDNDYSRATDVKRDEFELKTMHTFIEHKKPIYGICRGFQLLFLQFMNQFPDDSNMLTYVQHIEGHNQNELKIARSQPTHFIDWPSETVIAVNSFHHQACLINKQEAHKSKRLCPLAWTDRNSIKNFLVLESFKIPEWNVVAVQWHPEEYEEVDKLFVQHMTSGIAIQKQSTVFENHAGRKS
jgi:putative glutamine amidotransferase